MFDGLPLAIAQAAAYLQETGTEFEKYIEFYEQKWKELMGSRNWEGAPLQDYPDRSVWTTWAISFSAIRKTHVATANLLLLWALLDSKDLWYGLFAAACSNATNIATGLSEWIGDIASDELEFTKAIGLLRNYSLIENVQGPGSYATHPVVHRWAYYFQGEDSRLQLAQLAVIVVGWAVPHRSWRGYHILQRRLLPHAQACSRWIVMSGTRQWPTPESGIIVIKEIKLPKERVVMLDAVLLLGNLYQDQGKLDEAEKMYQRALQGCEKALGTEHTSTLNTVNNLGDLYQNQGKLDEAEKMYQRALRGYKKALGTNFKTYIPAFHTIWGLAILFERQGDPAKARTMYSKALDGYEKVVGPDHPKSQQLRDALHALDTVTQNSTLMEVREPVNRIQGETSGLGARERPSKSKRHRLQGLWKKLYI